MGLFDSFFDPPKPDKFAAMFMAALRDAGDPSMPRYNADTFCLDYDGREGLTNLRNFYDDYCAAPKSDRGELLKRQVRGSLSYLKEMPKEFDDAKCDIYPKMWTRAMLEKMRLQQRIEGEESLNIPTQPVGDHLEVSLAFDLPEAVRTISQGDLDDWGVNYYEAMEVARQNLESSDFAFASMGDSLYASLTGDTYDATRLLLLDLIRKLEVNGDHIAMVPNRDSLLVTGSEDETGLAMMYAFAEKALNDEPRPMTATPMRLDGDEWVEWMPPIEHSLYHQFRSLELMFLLSEYEQQKDLLETLHEQEVIPDFVASYSAIERKDVGQLVSYCAWSQGVTALLPKTHKVVFVRGEDDMPALGSWERVVEVVGHRMEATDHYPPRVRVTDFPSADELAVIGQEELQARGEEQHCMTMQDDFLKALAENEDEDDVTTRLVYADWLDEHGQHEEADRQRKWPAAKEWLVKFCEDFGGDVEEEFDADSNWSYFNITYRAMLKIGQKAIENASQEELLYFDCGANEPMCDALRANHSIFWPNVSIVTGVPLPAEFESKSRFGCSC